MSQKSKKDILQAPRGMRDFFGKEFEKREFFFTSAKNIATHYGFSGIETPILEHTPIFHKGVGEGTDIVDKEMYNLTTNGGDMLTLRPEGTAAVMRAYIEHGMGSLPGPQMFYYYGPFFRHEKPQKGRYRQLYQFGLEIMGSHSPLYDALIIKTGYDILKLSQKEIFVEINSLGSNEERATYIADLQHYYTENKSNIAESDARRIENNPLRILDSKESNTKKINEHAPMLADYLGEESKQHFDLVIEQLQKFNIPYTIIPTLVRGLGYYEHTVFEYVTKDEQGNTSHALGGGGRYDGLAETIGHNRAVPSVGLGLGADRIIEISESHFDNHRKKIPLILADASSLAQGVHLAKKYKDIKLYPLVQKLNKQLTRLEKEAYETILILGEHEIEKRTIILKNLKTREQKEIPQDTIAEYTE